jgi:hypothetical protein
MKTSENRSEPRKKACLQAFVSDLKDSFDIKCVIRDVSIHGCMIVTSQLHELPELIQLTPEGFDQPLNGKVMWRKDKLAGVTFLAADNEEIFERLNELRHEALQDADDDDEPVLLDNEVKPLGYADRLAKYNPRAK